MKNKIPSHHTKQWFIDHLKIDEYIKLEDFENRNKLKTNLCKEGSKCSRKDTCFFAHSEEEKRIPICSYGSRCYFNNCKFDHSVNAILPNFPTKSKNIDFTIELSDNEDDEKNFKRKEKSKKKLFVKIFKENKEFVDTVYNEMAKSPSTFKKTKKQEQFFDSINVTKEKVEAWEQELKLEETKKNDIKSTTRPNVKPKIVFDEESSEPIKMIEDKPINTSKQSLIIFDDDDDDFFNKKEVNPSPKSDNLITKFVSLEGSELEKKKKEIKPHLEILQKLKNTKRRLELLCSDEEFETVIKMLKAFDVKEL